MRKLLSFHVNGLQEEIYVEDHWTLLDVLRDQLGLTGAKEGCSAGECGACTVLLNRKPILACLTLAVACAGQELLTVEGLASAGALDPLQNAFIDRGAIQCGFCTPGMLLSARALLNSRPDPTVEEIKNALSGNLCRCTGYTKIIEAVRVAAAAEKCLRAEGANGAGTSAEPPAAEHRRRG